MSTEPEVVDVVGTELASVEPASATLFRTDDPAEVLTRATAAATALAPVLEQRKLFADIKGKRHVLVEGWLTLGAMLGVTPVCTWTRKLEDGWEARVEARTLDGRVVGAAEAECLTGESRWKAADDYAIRSMAQTRATSKALGSVLRFVVTLAGFEGTPAEEMPGGPASSGRSSNTTISEAQREKFIGRVAKRLQLDDGSLDAIARERFGVENVMALPRSKADEFVKAMETAAKEGIKTSGSDAPADTEGFDQPAPEHGDDLPWEPE